MKRLPLLILLTTSVVPTLLAGRPVYHCTISGSSGLACFCEAGSDDGFQGLGQETGCCCGRESVSDSDEPSGTSGLCTACTCCRVTVFRAHGPVPRVESEVPAPTIEERSFVAIESSSDRGFVVRRSVDGVRPPGDPPLFVLHASFLI